MLFSTLISRAFVISAIFGTGFSLCYFSLKNEDSTFVIASVSKESSFFEPSSTKADSQPLSFYNCQFERAKNLSKKDEECVIYSIEMPRSTKSVDINALISFSKNIYAENKVVKEIKNKEDLKPEQLVLIKVSFALFNSSSFENKEKIKLIQKKPSLTNEKKQYSEFIVHSKLNNSWEKMKTNLAIAKASILTFGAKTTYAMGSPFECKFEGQKLWTACSFIEANNYKDPLTFDFSKLKKTKDPTYAKIEEGKHYLIEWSHSYLISDLKDSKIQVKQIFSAKNDEQKLFALTIKSKFLNTLLKETFSEGVIRLN